MKLVLAILFILITKVSVVVGQCCEMPRLNLEDGLSMEIVGSSPARLKLTCGGNTNQPYVRLKDSNNNNAKFCSPRSCVYLNCDSSSRNWNIEDCYYDDSDFFQLNPNVIITNPCVTQNNLDSGTACTNGNTAAKETCENVLQAPTGVTWIPGSSWDRCPSGTYVIGFNLQVNADDGDDNTGLNTIRLYCGLSGQTITNNPITSKTGFEGTDGANVFCSSGYVTGFRLRFDDSPADGDETAANDLQLRCTTDAGGTEDLSSTNGEDDGTWLDWRNCNTDFAIQGIRTSVQDDQGAGTDDTALENVRMECAALLCGS